MNLNFIPKKYRNISIYTAVFAILGVVLILTTSAAPSALPPGVTLQEIDGGQEYFGQWSNSFTTDPNFFPVTVWAEGFNDDQTTRNKIDTYEELGVNTFAEPYGMPGPINDYLVSKNMYTVGGGTTAKAANMTVDEPDIFNCDHYGISYPSELGPCQNGPRGIAASYIQSWSDLLRANDPTRPVYNQFTKVARPGLGNWRADWGRNECAEWSPDEALAREYINTADIISYDWYTTTDEWSVPNCTGVAITGEGVRNARNFAGYAKPVMPFTETSRVADSSLGAPSPEEINALVWTNLIAGARGVQYFNHCFCSGTTGYTTSVLTDSRYAANSNQVRQTNALIKQLAPVLNAHFADGYTTTNVNSKEPHEVGFPTNDTLDMMTKYDARDGSFYIFAISRTNNQSVTFSTADAASVEVVNESRTIPVSNNSFSDNFATDRTVHIYKVTPDGGGVVDEEAPSTPSNLQANPISDTQINLSWDASTDNVGIASYKIFRNGSEIATTSSTNYSDNGLSANTTYSYTVLAADASGNESSQSSSASATTEDNTTPPPPPPGENFTVTNSKIYDPDGKEFIPIGGNVNGPRWIWAGETLGTYNGRLRAEIAKEDWKWNTIRLNTCIDRCDPTWAWDTNNNIDQIVQEYTSQKIVVQIEVHNYSGGFPSGGELTALKNWWVNNANKYKDNPYVWFNLINEPGDSPSLNSTWEAVHDEIITDIRNAGADNMIVVDGTSWGQEAYEGWNCPSNFPIQHSGIYNNGPNLVNEHGNVVFAVHIYGWWGGDNCSDAARENMINQYFDYMEEKGLSVHIGEIQGLSNLNEEPSYQKGQTAAARAFFRVATQRNFGLLYWHANQGSFPSASLMNNNTDWFNINGSASNLSEWGQLMLGVANHIETVTGSTPTTCQDPNANNTGNPLPCTYDTNFNQADINQDGTVGIVDLSILLNNWDPQGTGHNDQRADINNDNNVGIIDLSIMLNNWGQ